MLYMLLWQNFQARLSSSNIRILVENKKTFLEDITIFVQNHLKSYTVW